MSPERLKIVRNYVVELIEVAKANGVRSSASPPHALRELVSLGERHCLEDVLEVLDETPRTEAPHKPIAWIATHERGTVNHYSIADGWKVEAVQSVVSPLERK